MRHKTIVSIICITIILALCIWREIDGILMSGGLIVIAGLGGYAAGKVKPPQ